MTPSPIPSTSGLTSNHDKYHSQQYTCQMDEMQQNQHQMAQVCCAGDTYAGSAAGSVLFHVDVADMHFGELDDYGGYLGMLGNPTLYIDEVIGHSFSELQPQQLAVQSTTQLRDANGACNDIIHRAAISAGVAQDEPQDETDEHAVEVKHERETGINIFHISYVTFSYNNL